MTEQPRIVLEELVGDGVRKRLDAAQASALAAVGLVEVRPDGDGWWRLRPNGKVGAARIGELDVQVQPKVGINRLLFLLGYAADPGFRPQDVTAVSEPELWPALAESLIRQVDRALAAGVLQGYRPVDEALPLVRGRIRFADQLRRRPGVPLPIEVSYDEYAVDIAENQILRSALRCMASVPRLAASTRSRLTYLDGRLDGVGLLRHGAPLPAWQVSRLNARYVPALRLAALVLRHQSAEPGPGGLAVSAFVVDMARVFEDFVTTALCEALVPYQGDTYGQFRSHLDEGGAIPIRPDAVHVVDGRPVAVFDAKYKLESAGSRYPGSDSYQMLAYCTALGLRTGWLVYARGAAPPATHRVCNTTVDIKHYALDLTAPPRDLLGQVATLTRLAMISSGG